MTDQRTEMVTRGKRLYALLIITMAIAYLSYTAANIYVFHSKQVILIFLSFLSFALTCFGYRWAKKIYSVCAAIFAAIGMFFLLGNVYYFLRFGQFYRWFTSAFAVLFGGVHGFSLYLLALPPTKLYLGEIAAQRNAADKNRKKKGHR